MKKIRRINLKLTAALITMMLIIITSCTDDIADKHNAAQPGDRTITLRAAMPQDNSSTRIALEESEGTLNLIAKWEEDDVIQLFFVQGETIVQGSESTVFNISVDGKTSSFNITVPEEIDLNEPFDLYFFCGISGQGVQLIDGEILADITPVKSVSLDELSVPVWTKVENISLLTADIELAFSHLGAYEVIHLKNESSQNLEVSESFLIPKDSNSSLWYHNADGENYPTFNPVNGDFASVRGEVSPLTASNIVIEPGTIKTTISWYAPNGEVIPGLSLKMNETISENSKEAKDFAMQAGKAYHIYAVWDGIKLTVTDDDYITDLPEIVLTTAKSIGSTINLYISTAVKDRAEAWIDLNNNGIRETGEDVIFGADHDYTIQSQTITIYGKVTSFNCNNNQLTNLNVTKNEQLKTLNCYNNQLANLDVTKNEKLEGLSCVNNLLTNLDVTKNFALQILYCNNNQLTNLDITKNFALQVLYCYNNQLTNLNVTKNEKLEYLWCDNNQLTNLDVTNNEKLIHLYCDYNKLTNLDVSKNEQLENLNCSDNQLTSLDITKNEQLEKLWCYDNQLTSLELSKNKQLEYLSCTSNQLIDLDLTKNELLSELYCQNNKLISINVSNNEQLITLWCPNNKLTSLDVSNNEQLDELWCSNNPITCIKVNQTQFDNIPTNWLKSSAATYSLTCD